ncbi:MAG TPA: hypothetical protein VK629_16235 [Steroidobacteraceae bacterium]|nr:hypothetical protein [Steroidobacteraceae bacterium]
MTNRAAIDSNPTSNASGDEAPLIERRSEVRADEEGDWESRALARVSGHLRSLPDEPQQPLGWEQTVLDVLRRRIERGPQ